MTNFLYNFSRIIDLFVELHILIVEIVVRGGPVKMGSLNQFAMLVFIKFHNLIVKITTFHFQIPLNNSLERK